LRLNTRQIKLQWWSLFLEFCFRISLSCRTLYHTTKDSSFCTNRKGKKKANRMEKPARILIIDDDEDIRKVLQTILEDEGYVIDFADTAQKGIQKSKQSFFNLALIDVRLPDMEGIQLLSKLNETKPKMRKIIVTGFPTLQNAKGAVNKGADAYVMKPFDVEKILFAIKEQLRKQAEERQFSEIKIAQFIETRVKELESKAEAVNREKA
jgi:DNA-binding NtrC family response regulator